jgi:hypothetical protein
MTGWQILSDLLAGKYAAVNWVLLIAGILLCVFLLRRFIWRGFKEEALEKLNVATKKDIETLRKNDLFHTNKALLLFAKGMLGDSKPEWYHHIRDTILETTPDEKKAEIKEI